ncbi:hypothetical protein [Iningainema tapete]|uniref:Uncharacterized protein n=1 Tax=Iningainema tapete BLCC-T55 TaxID=2748662 RepID=A0A8J6XMT0_9CYAN|nr:hypothetical protein [Iningainema tapete]MBD2773871.1 hypothetical protein [Iningainema tapete BLCC-T55]
MVQPAASSHLAFWPLVIKLLEGLGLAAESAVAEVTAAEVAAAASEVTATEAAEAATFRAVAGTANGIEVALAGSLKIDAATLRNALNVGGFVGADLTARVLYNVYTKYQEHRQAAGMPLNPCKPIIIRPEGSDKSFSIYDSEACPSIPQE